MNKDKLLDIKKSTVTIIACCNALDNHIHTPITCFLWTPVDPAPRALG